jgi:hypothetical protein
LVRYRPAAADTPQVNVRHTDNDEGFGLVEVAIAMVIFMFAILGFQTVLTASIKSYSQSRGTTLGQQIASDQLEQARRMPWADLGTLAGNPRGTIKDVQTITVGTIDFTVTTKVVDVLNAVTFQPENLRRVTVTVSRPGQSSVILETVIASPEAQSLFNGVVRATMQDGCQDSAHPVAVPGVVVQLNSGPSAIQAIPTEANGVAQFTQLIPTNVPAPIAGDYYDVTPDPSYQFLPGQGPIANINPATWRRWVQNSLDPSQVLALTLNVFKVGTLTAHVKMPDGTEAVGVPGTLQVSHGSPATFTGTATAATLPDTVSVITSGSTTEQIVPCGGNKYTFTFTPRGQAPLSVAAPLTYTGSYPDGDLDIDGSVTLAPTVQQVVRVTRSTDSTPVVGATVTLTGGGPIPLATPMVRTTDVNGNATFDVLYSTVDQYTATVAAYSPPAPTTTTSTSTTAPTTTTTLAAGTTTTSSVGTSTTTTSTVATTTTTVAPTTTTTTAPAPQGWQASAPTPFLVQAVPVVKSISVVPSP